MNFELKNSKIFISYSNLDKEFASRLVVDLSQRNLKLWIDQNELKVGDSIIEKISKGLSECGYFIVILSNNSVNSLWVQQELGTVLTRQFLDKGVIILPVLLDNCDVPTLLIDRIYADFRTDYKIGFESLCGILDQEIQTVDGLSKNKKKSFELVPSKCKQTLGSMSLAQLRQLINLKMSRSEINTVWFDIFECSMEEDYPNKSKMECIIGLLVKTKSQERLKEMIETLCNERPDLTR